MMRTFPCKATHPVHGQVFLEITTRQMMAIEVTEEVPAAIDDPVTGEVKSVMVKLADLSALSVEDAEIVFGKGRTAAEAAERGGHA